MKIETQKLRDAQLDYAVAICEGWARIQYGGKLTQIWMQRVNARGVMGSESLSSLCYTTDWAKAGPIIERERIRITPFPPGRESEGWAAGIYGAEPMMGMCGSTTLIAAMRCYVASKLGDTVEVQDELLSN